MTKFPTTELIRWLESAIGSSKIDLKSASPTYWKQVPLLGRFTYKLGMSKTSWWREKFLYPSLIEALIPHLNRITNRQFVAEEEYSLERLWRRLLELIQLDVIFRGALESQMQKISLQEMSFPKFSLVRKSIMRNSFARRTTSPSEFTWHSNELLCDYENRYTTAPPVVEQPIVSQKKSPTKEITEQKKRTHVFQELGYVVKEFEKRWSRVGAIRKDLMRSAILYRFEAPQLLQSAQTLVSLGDQIDDRVLSLAMALQAHESAGLVRQIVENETVFEEWALDLLTSWQGESKWLEETLEQYQKVAATLQDAIRHVRSTTQSHFHRLEKVVQRAAHFLTKHPYQALARVQINESKGLLHSFEKDLRKVPGPTCQLAEIEETIQKNLSFIEMLAQNSER